MSNDCCYQTPGRVYLKRKYVLKYINSEDKKAPHQQQIISEYYLVGYTQILAGH